LNTYEAMLLFDPSLGADLGKVEAEVNRLMERSGGRVLMWGKWDERRLAYPIKRHKRGVYVLVYFQAEADRITGLERDVQLSESVLRSLVLRADHVSEEQMRESLGRSAQQAAPEEDRSEGKPREGAPETGARGGDESASPPRETPADTVAETSSQSEKPGEDEA